VKFSVVEAEGLDVDEDFAFDRVRLGQLLMLEDFRPSKSGNDDHFHSLGF
jgi:hypothetical protein